MQDMRKQAERFGTTFVSATAESSDLSKRPFKIEADGKNYLAETLIISTGASAKWLGLDSEKKLYSKGVSACATCDGFFFKNQVVMVVGGGDTAIEEALFLTHFAKEVHIIHRRDQLRASEYMQKMAFDNEKIKFIWDSVVQDILGVEEDKVTGVKIKNVKTGEVTEQKCDGVFIAIGHKPNSDIFKSQLDLDADEYIVTKPGRTSTKVEGVFACGDVQDSYYRQAITAAGTGCMAAIEAERFLASL
jgi:thioredoxin reductase (NADPH)